MDGRAAAWTRELNSWWQYYNLEFARGVLRRPVIAVSGSGTQLGTWERDARRIRIAARHIDGDPWLSVMETLRHEMAHQYADEIVGARDEPPHGPSFREACQLLRVTPRASGHGGAHRGHPRVDPARDRIHNVVAKLLSLAGSPNENEAEAAIRKARHLMLRHNIELGEVRAERCFSSRQVGPVRRRHHAYEHALALILNEFFFVEVIWVDCYDAARDAPGSVLHLYGTESNLEMATYVYSFLCGLLPSLWIRHKSHRGVRSDRDRLQYFEGVLQGFHQKLRAQDKELEESEALVRVDDPELRVFFRWHNPRIRIRHGSGTSRTAAFEAGRRDGRAVTIHRPLSHSGGFGGYLRE